MSENLYDLTTRAIEDPDWVAMELAGTGNRALNVINEIENRCGTEKALRFAQLILKYYDTNN